MKPVRCATCDLQWNIRDDAPSVITCPRCLAALNNPYAQTTSTSPPTLPSGTKRVIAVEQQMKRDTRAGMIGIVVVLFIVVFGVLGLFAAGVSGAESSTVLLIALGMIVAASVAAVIFSLKWKRGAPASVAGISGGAASTTTGAAAILNYQPAHARSE